MEKDKLIYIVLILAGIYLGLRIVKMIIPLLIFASIAIAVYAMIDSDFRAKVKGVLTYLKNKIFR